MWQKFMELARQSAKEIEILTHRIANGGKDWSPSGPKVHTPNVSSPTERAAIMEMTVVAQLEAERDEHIARVGMALAAIQAVREQVGQAEGDVLEMFYIDGFLTWEIANELSLTVDGVFYRKRKALRWMDENLTIPR